MTTIREALACPFCGSDNVTDEQGSTYRWRMAVCNECRAQGPEVHTQVTGSGAATRALLAARNDAFEAWNQRSALAESEARAALAAQPAQALTPETMKCGARYNWKNQPDRLVYRGKLGKWHQFRKIGDLRDVWCEVLDEDLHMLEETKP